MFAIFTIFGLFSLISLSSQSVLRVVSDGSNQRVNDSNNSNVSLKHNADHAVITHLHKAYNTELQKKDVDMKQLLILKQQYMVRNHIEEFETDLSLTFVPDWDKVDKWSSPARQSIEIRRQRWEYIFGNHSDLDPVKNLVAELDKSGVNRSVFCREIAEAYFILSHNSYVYNKGLMPNSRDHKIPEFANHPMMDQSLRIFLQVVPDSHVKVNATAEELVQIPKSVYHQLLRKDTHINLLKKHHESEMKRQKNNYENAIRDIQEDSDDDYSTDTSDSSSSSYRKK